MMNTYSQFSQHTIPTNCLPLTLTTPNKPRVFHRWINLLWHEIPPPFHTHTYTLLAVCCWLVCSSKISGKLNYVHHANTDWLACQPTELWVWAISIGGRPTLVGIQSEKFVPHVLVGEILNKPRKIDFLSFKQNLTKLKSLFYCYS